MCCYYNIVFTPARHLLNKVMDIVCIFLLIFSFHAKSSSLFPYIHFLLRLFRRVIHIPQQLPAIDLHVSQITWISLCIDNFYPHFLQLFSAKSKMCVGGWYIQHYIVKLCTKYTIHILKLDREHLAYMHGVWAPKNMSYNIYLYD